MKELLLRYDEDAGAGREVKEPYITIEIETEEDFNFIQDAIAKQTAKKPYSRQEGSQKAFYCQCKHYLGDAEDFELELLRPVYCDECGQRLDWSETK